MVESADRPDPLQASNCSQCGYDLTGLPRRGRCPECGAPFDQAQPAADAQNAKAGRLQRYGPALLLAGLAAMCLVCGGLVRLNTASAWPVWTAVLISGALILGAVTSYLYKRHG